MTDRLLTCLLCACLAGATALAQEPRERLPDGAALLDEMERAAWQEAEIDGVESLVMEARCSFRLHHAPDEPVQGRALEFYRGDKAYVLTDFERFGRMEEGTDGTVTWQIDPMVGPLILSGDDAATLQRIWALTRGESWRDHYTEATCTGSVDVGGRPCWKVVLKPKRGKAENWYVDRNKLLAGVDLRMRTPAGPEDLEVRLSDWRPVDGVLYPFATTVKTGHVLIDMEYRRIAHNVEIPASRFTLPEPVAKLLASVKEKPPPDGKEVGVEFTELPERPMAAVRLRVKHRDIGRTLAQVIPEVMGYLLECGAVPAGPPFTRYHAFEAEEVDLEAGFPVAKPVAGRGRIKAGVLPGGRVALAEHLGHYNQLGLTYQRVEKWLSDQGLEFAARWEVYLTDPGREPDSSKWRTQLYWAIK